MGLPIHPRSARGVCTRSGKDKFTKSVAKSKAKQHERQTGRNIQAYRCRMCGQWHVGTTRGS
jgi:hypothetical protein